MPTASGGGWTGEDVPEEWAIHRSAGAKRKQARQPASRATAKRMGAEIQGAETKKAGHGPTFLCRLDILPVHPWSEMEAIYLQPIWGWLTKCEDPPAG